jgi:hypothetical protein
MYQVVGSTFNWPTYQTLMGDIPTANDRTLDGYLYSGAYGAFRATGFFPADVSHYAGYMAGIVVLGLALMVYDRRWVLPYVASISGAIGLIFSLSRSGILACIVIGIPTLFFLLSKIRPVGRVLYRSVLIPGVIGIVLFGVVGPIVVSSYGIELPNASKIIESRLADIFDPGSNARESMSEHLATRMAGLNAFATHPLLGVGLGVNATPWFDEFAMRGWGGSHSYHLDVLGQTGLIGAVLQFLVMGLAIRLMWRAFMAKGDLSIERHALAGLLAAYIAIVFGQFMYAYYMNDFVWFLMGTGVAMSRLILLESRQVAAIAEPSLATAAGVGR